MDHKKDKGCSMHKTLEKIQVLKKPAIKSFLSSIEDLEKEVGKGDPNWFVERSRQISKPNTLTSIEKTPVLKSQLLELSPVGSVSKLLNSQFSETSPQFGWIAPSLGRSPIAGTARHYQDSQNGLIKSLGVNDSTLSWTSSLATPNHGLVSLPEVEFSPDQGKKKGFSRKLFSPDDRAGGIHQLPHIVDSPSIKTEKHQLAAENDMNFSPSKAVKELHVCDASGKETLRQSNKNVSIIVKTDTLEDALSDFFDPPSKAAGRRRSAPSFRSNIPVNKRKRLKSLSQGQGNTSEIGLGLAKDNLKDTINTYCEKSSITTSELINSVEKSSSDINSRNTENKTDTDSIYMENNPEKMDKKDEHQQSLGETDLSIEDRNFIYMKNLEKPCSSGHQKKGEDFRDSDLFCSTPIDTCRMTYKSILSTSKKKTPASKKQVRFDVVAEVKSDIEHCNASENIASITEEGKQSFVNRKTTSNNETDNTKLNNNLVSEVKSGEENEKDQEDLFSQVSPSALEEMCFISSDKTNSSEVIKSVSLSSKVINGDQNKTADVFTVLEQNKTKDSSILTECNRSVPKKDTATNEKRNVTAQRKPLKRKMFFYPTSSQINTSCPKSVYGFKEQQKDVAVDVMNDNVHKVQDHIHTADKPVTPDITGSTKAAEAKVTPTTDTSKSIQGSCSLGFKRYSDMLQCKVNSENHNISPVPASTQQQSVREDTYSTPKSIRRDSLDLKRRRILASDVELLVKTPVHKSSYLENSKGATCDNLLQDVESDMFDDDLPDDSFAREISIDTTIDKLSCSSLKTPHSSFNTDLNKSLGKEDKNLNSCLSKEVLSENFDKQYELSQFCENQDKVCLNNSEKEIKSTKSVTDGKCISKDVVAETFTKQFMFINDCKENILRAVNDRTKKLNSCQDFKTAGGSPVDIALDKFAKAEKLMDPVDINKTINFADDFVLSQEVSGDSCEIRHPFCKQKSGTKILDLEIKVDDEKNITKTISNCRIVNNKVCETCNDPDKEKEPKHNRLELSCGSMKGTSVPAPKVQKEDVIKECQKMESTIHPDNNILPKNNEKQHQFHGFVSASGNKLSLSTASLSKAQKLMNEVMTEEGFKSSEKDQKKDGPGYKALEEKNKLKNGESDLQSLSLTNLNMLTGFSTASEKNLKPNVSSLVKANKLMEDKQLNGQVENNEDEIFTDNENFLSGSCSIYSEKGLVKCDDTCNSSNDSSTKPGKGFKLSESRLSRDKTLMINMESVGKGERSTNTFLGFSSASGKTLKLSETSLSKAQRLLEEASAGSECTGVSELERFSTGSGNRLSKSDFSFSTAQISKDTKTPCLDLESYKLGGFTTASGKDFKLSESSVVKAQTILKESNENDFEHNNVVCHAFSSSEENLKTTNSSLTKSQTILKNSDLLDLNNTNNSIVGFATASGKDLFLTDSGLSKAKSILNDASEDNNFESIATAGFSSASGKDFQVSSKSLSETLGILQENQNCIKVERSGSDKTKKDLFEDIFNNLSGCDISSVSNSANKDIEPVLQHDLPLKEPSKIFSSINQKSKRIIQAKPTQSSRFPPGANVPKGFRPFKPPKIIGKPKEPCVDKTGKDTEQQIEVTTAEPCLNEGSNRSELKTEVMQIKHDLKNEVMTDNFDGTCLYDVFSDDMLPSQKFSPESGRPLKRIKLDSGEHHVLTVNTHPQIMEESYQNSKESVVGEKSAVGNVGDGQGSKYLNVDPDIDFKGDNSLFALEQMMDPSNEFTQVMLEDDNLSLNELNKEYQLSSNSSSVPTVNNPFQSASGTVITVSEKALKHSRKTMNNLDCYIKIKGEYTSEKLEASALQIVPDLTSGIENECSNMINNLALKNMNPFQSASGKAIAVSEKALLQARKTLNDEEPKTDLTFEDNDFNIDEKTLVLTNRYINGDVQSPTPKDKTFQEPIFSNTCPFQCASGKNITISDNALQQARKSLNDSDYSSDITLSNVTSSTLHTTFTNGYSSFDDNLKQENALLLNNPFKSASGDSVTVSEIALNKARQTSCENDFTPKVLFKSASGKNVEVSDNALKQVSQSLNSGQKSSHVDFGKTVTISDNIPNVIRKESSNPFQSESDKSVNFPEESLQRAREKLGGETLHIGFKPQPSFKDTSVSLTNPFQCASGRSVKISEQSLQQAREMFDEDSSPVSTKTVKENKDVIFSNNSSNQFQIASGRTVQVSESSLQKARETLSDDKTPEKMVNCENIGTKRKRSDFEDDFDVPFELLEQMEMHEKKLKLEQNTGGKKPLSTLPEDYSRDRTVPGFSPKPLRSTSSTKQKNENIPCQTPTFVPKSTFHTPYKSSIVEPVSVTEKKVKQAIPVFIPKSSTALHPRDSNSTNSMQLNSTDGKIQYSINQKSSVHKHVNSAAIRDDSQSNQIGSFTVNENTVQSIRKARHLQEERIKAKTKKKVQPVEGRLYQMKQRQGRLKIKNVISWQNQESLIHVYPSTKQVRCGNASQHKFYLPDFYGKQIHSIIVGDGAILIPDDKGYVGKQEFYQAFLTLDGVDSNLIDEKWFNNHYRWVVWKLAAYEVSCPQIFAGRCLTPEVVMLQMKYRYDREIDKCQRSAIMKICERDDTPTKRMVLCVSSIELNSSRKEPKITLTDGWYSINTDVDGPLTTLINKGKIQVGQKLCVSGAELVGTQNACPPLEAPESLVLKLCCNSTRPAPCDARLGYQTDHTPLCIPLSSVHGEGGLIGCLDVVVVRKYPTMFMEKLPAGGCVFRTQTAEEKYKQTFQQIKQEKMEKLYIQMEKEQEKNVSEEKIVTRKKWTSKEIESLSTGEEIYEAINTAKYPDDVQMNLSTVQLELLMKYQRSLQEEKRQKMNSKFQKAWSEGEQNMKDRIVVPLMKLRVVGCCRKDSDNQSSYLLTIWRPSSGHYDLQEGKRYKIYSLTSSSPRPGSSGIPLTATKQTQFKPLSLDDNILDIIYESREVSTKQDVVRKRPPYKEVDLVGIVISVIHSTFDNSGKQMDTVYLADINEDLIGVKFWGGLKHVGLSDTLKEGVICCCSNLCDKSNYPSVSLPVVEYTSELSVVSQTTQYSAQTKHVDKLKLKIKDKDFLLSSKDRLDDKLNRKNGTGTSNKSSESTNNNCKAENTMDQSTLNPLSNIENMIEVEGKMPNPKVSSKMAALMSYSSPAPLSPLVLSSTKSINRAFKSPMLTKK